MSVKRQLNGWLIICPAVRGATVPVMEYGFPEASVRIMLIGWLTDMLIPFRVQTTYADNL